jgi:hypothetical protein
MQHVDGKPAAPECLTDAVLRFVNQGNANFQSNARTSGVHHVF